MLAPQPTAICEVISHKYSHTVIYRVPVIRSQSKLLFHMLFFSWQFFHSHSGAETVLLYVFYCSPSLVSKESAQLKYSKR